MQKTILIADDNFDNRTIIGHMLKIGGYKVIYAADGRQALDLAATSTPDLILMDLAMPVLDGWNATARLKANPELAHIPVIVITGHVTTDDINRARDAGCNDYIAKPIDFDQLFTKIRRYVA